MKSSLSIKQEPLLSRMVNWVRNNRLEAITLSVILLVSAFLRLYKIDEYMTFLGDEGRDAIIVRNLLVHADPILIGPGTSIGNMYLGPHYYYLIAPFLFLANFSPVGPSVMVALLSILTVFGIWYIAREWFGKTAAFVASILYAVSPVVIIYSRSSWNPNVMPFFALLAIYSIWRVFKNSEYEWIWVSAVSLAMALNSHYLALLLMPVLGIYWLLTLVKIKNSKSVKNYKFDIKRFTQKSLFGLLIFAVFMSPLVIFDARHNWINFSAMKKFFTVRQETVSIKPWSSLGEIYPITQKIMTRLLGGTKELLGGWITLIIAIASFLGLISFLKKHKGQSRGTFFINTVNSPYFLLFLWIGFAILGLSLYKQEIYDHYYGFFFPAPFILLGALSQELVKKSKWIGGFFLLLATGYLLLLNLDNSPLKYPPNKQLQRSEAVAKFIVAESKGREFNFAVIAERNYEGAYQYFFEKDEAPLLLIDSQLIDKTVADQLFVVCELPKEKCDPTHNPKAGIANFGWSEIESTTEVEGVTVFKLIHSLPQP